MACRKYFKIFLGEGEKILVKIKKALKIKRRRRILYYNHHIGIIRSGILTISFYKCRKYSRKSDSIVIIFWNFYHTYRHFDGKNANAEQSSSREKSLYYKLSAYQVFWWIFLDFLGRKSNFDGEMFVTLASTHLVHQCINLSRVFTELFFARFFYLVRNTC